MQKTVSRLLIFGVVIFFANYGFAENTTTTFFVSTEGNGRWSGRLPAPNVTETDGPFATLKQARNSLREKKAERACVFGIFNGTEQELIVTQDGNDTVLKGMLIKDYPVLIRVSK